jgi:hypothetical protein
VSVAWKSDWHYGYPKGIELPDGDILYFSRYGENHDARSIALTRVKREFLNSARVSQDADGGHFEDGVFYITRSDAKLTAINRRELSFPVESDIEFAVDDLAGRFQMLAITGEGTMEMIALGVNGFDGRIEVEMYELDIKTCQAKWRPLGISLRAGEVCRARLTLQDPWSYQLEISDRIFTGHTVKPLIPYTTQIGINLTLDDPLRKTNIHARILGWNLSAGQQNQATGTVPGTLWDEARPCYRFITTHFAYDENGPFHGSVPRIGVDLSIPQGRWGAMDNRNPVYVDTNTSGTGDGVLLVDKPFRSTEGTVAFWGLPMNIHGGDEVLLDCGDFRIGISKRDGMQPFFTLKDRSIRGSDLPGTTGLYAWRWRFTETEIEMSFVYVSPDGHLTNVGGGVIPKVSWQESLPKWFNTEDETASFKARITSIGAWRRVLSQDELTHLRRY